MRHCLQNKKDNSSFLCELSASCRKFGQGHASWNVGIKQQNYLIMIYVTKKNENFHGLGFRYPRCVIFMYLYSKNLKNSNIWKNCCVYPGVWTMQFCHKILCPKDAVAGWLQGHWWGFISRIYVVWPTFLLMNVFIALKGSHFWFLFDFTAAGVVPCGGHKMSPRTSTIVQFIFYFGPLRSAIIFWEIRNKWLV